MTLELSKKRGDAAHDPDLHWVVAATQGELTATQPPRSCAMPRFPWPGKRVFRFGVKSEKALDCSKAFS